MTSKTSPEGVHAIEGVEYLARASGWRGDKLPALVILPVVMGFSEITAFVKTSGGRGYYKTTLTTCACPSFKFRGGPCKHQRVLAERLERKARIDERKRRRREERARRLDREDDIGGHGFNLPEEART